MDPIQLISGLVREIELFRMEMNAFKKRIKDLEDLFRQYRIQEYDKLKKHD